MSAPADAPSLEEELIVPLDGADLATSAALDARRRAGHVSTRDARAHDLSSHEHALVLAAAERAIAVLPGQFVSRPHATR